MYAVILLGVNIRNNCIIGVNAVVGGNIPDGSVVAGNYARIICTIDDYREKLKNALNKARCADIEECRIRNAQMYVLTI